MEIRNKFIKYMNDKSIMCIFHYVPLHSSPAGKKYGVVASSMECTDNAANTLARLPLFYGMDAQNRIIDCARSFLSSL